MGEARDMVGYGRTPPQADWPGGARVAVQIVLNYEEGGENCILHGDSASEAFLSEIVGAAPWPGQRHMNMESIYEYGSRAGFWRLWRLFTERGVPVTVFGVATALARNPEAVAAMREARWEIACHGLKWIEHRDFAREEEAAQMDAAVRLHEAVTGSAPLGWYTGRSSVHTLELGLGRGFAYLADSYADDLPYWLHGRSGTGLVVPYTLDANDMRFATAQGFNTGEQFFAYLRDTFDVLYAEGATAPKMMSVGLHCRLVGRPGRMAALVRFLDHVARHEDVWLARRIDIARHWMARHPAEGLTPSRMGEGQFVAAYGDVFEDMPEIAAAAWRAGLTAREDGAEGLHAALVGALRALPRERQRALVLARPEQEFAEALREVERIAWLRLKDRLPAAG